MRVAVIHNLVPGGARRTIEQHLPHFASDVVELCPATATPVTAEASVVPMALHAASVPRGLRPPLRYADLVAVVRCWRMLARRMEALQPDVVLAHPCQFTQAPAALLWSDVPAVYFCHEPRRVDYEPAAAATVNPQTKGIYAPLHGAYRWLDRSATARAAEIVTNSRYTADRIHAAYDRTATPVPMGAVELFRPAPEPVVPRHVLTVGALLPSKGHDLVLRSVAATKARRPVIVVTARQGGEEQARLHALARQLDVSLEVRVGVEDAELRDLYRSALATAYLAREEPLGLVALEAQAAGCPVVVANEGGLPETVVDGETGFVVPRDPALVAERLEGLEDPAVRRPLAERAAEHGAAATWQRSAQAVEDHLRRVAPGV